jgi:hypothetical protein
MTVRVPRLISGRYLHAGRQTVPLNNRIERSCFQIKQSSKGNRLRSAFSLAPAIGSGFIVVCRIGRIGGA